MTKIEEQYGRRMTLLRAMHGYAMEDLARMTGITKQAISKFERGKMKFSHATLIGICKIFDVREGFFTDESIVMVLKGNNKVQLMQTKR